MMARPIVDLPQPDSPTSATVSPGARSKDTPLTAVTTWLRAEKRTVTSRTSSSGLIRRTSRQDRSQAPLRRPPRRDEAREGGAEMDQRRGHDAGADADAASDETHGRAGRHGDERGADANGQRRTRTGDHAAKNVATELAGAQRLDGRGRRQEGDA